MSWLWDKLRGRKAIQVETAEPGRVEEKKGFLARGTFDKLVPHPDNLDEFEKYYKNDNDVHVAINRLAAMCVGVGYYTETEDERAKEIVDNFAEQVGLDQILLNVVKNMLIYGFCPVERWLVKGPPAGVLRLKVLPSRTVWVKRDRKGKVLGFKQKLNGHSNDFTEKELVFFVYNQVGVNPYGTSVVAPVLTLIKAKEQTHEDMPKIIHRYASPLTVWETDGDISSLKDGVTEREPNEDIFFGNIREGEVRFKTVEMDPRGRFTDYIANIDDAIIEGLDAPIIRSLRNATEASAKVQLETYDRKVQGIQRYLKRVIEREIFQPLLARLGVTVVPSICWGLEKTGVEDLDLDGVANLVGKRAITPLQAQKLLKKMGLPLEDEEDIPPEPDEPDREPEP